MPKLHLKTKLQYFCMRGDSPSGATYTLTEVKQSKCWPTIRIKNMNRSKGFARAAYFVPGRDGIGAWPISKIAPPLGAPSSVTDTYKNQIMK